MFDKRKLPELPAFCYQPRQIINDQCSYCSRNKLAADGPTPSVFFNQVKKASAHGQHGNGKTQNDHPYHNIFPEQFIFDAASEQAAEIGKHVKTPHRKNEGHYDQQNNVK